MNQKNNYFQALHKVSKSFNSTLDKDALLELIVDTTRDLLDLKATSIYMTDEAQDKMNLLYQKGLSEDYIVHGLTGAKKILPVLKKEGCLYAQDAASDKRLDKHQAKKQEGIATMLIVPITVEDSIIGIMTLYTSTPRTYSERDIEFATALAEQAGMALEIARLVTWLRRNNQLIQKFTTEIHSSLDLKDVLSTLTREIVDFLDIKGSSILLFDENMQRLEFVAGYGLSQNYAARDRLVVESSVAQTLEGQTVYIENAQEDERVKYKDAKKKEGIVSILSVPIHSQKGIIGALRLYCGTKRVFAQDQIDLVQSLASIGGMAIQNASLYSKVNQELKDLEEDIWSHRAWF
ncbi:MAG: GAF domain-containing protein [Desulfohalobiaceae bacterium]